MKQKDYEKMSPTERFNLWDSLYDKFKDYLVVDHEIKSYKIKEGSPKEIFEAFEEFLEVGKYVEPIR